MTTTYYKITEKELLALIEVSDSMLAMSGGGDDNFDKEAKSGKKAINSILKRAGLERVARNKQSVVVDNIS